VDLEALRDDRLPSRLGQPQILLSPLFYSIQAVSLLTIIAVNPREKHERAE